MACLHRFHENLLPPSGMHYLFIGTFNPIWNIKKGDNPDFFYSRDKNQFWCILPHAFNQNCLVDKNKLEKMKFCIFNKIGLTDLIYCLKNVNEQSETDKLYLTKGFKDEDFEMKRENGFLLDIDFFTKSILSYINSNRKSLKGVFLTRKTKKDIPRIWEQWILIKSLCKDLDIYAEELSSPSVRGGGVRSKIFLWRKAIESTEANKNKRVR